jgi:predicted metal-binding membrane protein
VAYLGDALLHATVSVTPLLAERPWLVEASVLAGAGLYQLTPHKRRALEACRRPQEAVQEHFVALRGGTAHAIDCIVASGPLMLLMFAAGFASLWWMAALTAVMTYETLGRHGDGVRRVAGLGLVYLAVLALTNQGLPVL